MNTDYDEIRFQLKFNAHKMMPIPVEDDDIARIAAIFDCPRKLLDRINGEFRGNVLALSQKLGKTHARKIAAIRKRGRKVICIGDSITSDRESYQKILAAAFRKDANVAFIDAAVSGDTTKDLRDRLYNTILCHQFDTATIFIGTNDARMFDNGSFLPLTGLSDYEMNLKYLIRCLSERTNAIYLITLPYADNRMLERSFGDRKFFYTRGHIDCMNALIRKIAAETGCGVIDCAVGLKERRNSLEADGLHLNTTAQLELAGMVLKAIV